MTDARRLLEAVWADDPATVAALISAGVDVNATHEPHWPPLFQAIERRRIEIARRLIEAGAEVNKDVGEGWTPLVHAIDIESDAAWQAHHETGHESTELTTLLLSAGAVPTERAFELAREYNNRRVLSLLSVDSQSR
jgi:ankyrin repeat protein